MSNISSSDTRMSASTAMRNHIDSFYKNADEFMRSKRFLRFVGIIECKVKEFLLDLHSTKTSRDTGSTIHGESVSAREAVESCVYQHILVKCEKENDEPKEETERINGKLYGTMNYSLRSVLDIFPDRLYSNLWSLQGWFADAGISKWAVDDEGEPLVAKSAEIILDDNNLITDLYTDALHRTCFDYIVRSAVESEFQINGENWLSRLKNPTRAQVLYIMSGIYKRALHSIEDFSAYRLLYTEDADSPLHKLLDKINANKAEQEQGDTVRRLEELLGKKDKALKAQEQENRELAKKLSAIEEKVTAESDAQRELRRIKGEYEKLQEKYDSLLYFAEQLEAPEDEAEADNFVPDESFKRKRIVFVRDKKHEGYVIMQKLAEYFPNAKFTNCIASDINAQTTDLIVQMIPYVSHGTYWNAESIARRKEIPMFCINNTNFDTLIARIYDVFQKQ